MIRFVHEVEPTLEQIRKVADGLENLPGAQYRFSADHGPRAALLDLVKQLEERRL